MECRNCKDGYYVKGDQTCGKCSDKIPGCKRCSFFIVKYFCHECDEPSRRNYDCSDEPACINVNCLETWKTETGACKCTKCPPGQVLVTDLFVEYGLCVPERIPGLLPNCFTEQLDRSKDTCLKCQNGYNKIRSVNCLDESPMFNCEPGYIVAEDSKLHCLKPKENHYINNTFYENPVPVENSSLSTTNCLGYSKYEDSPGFLARCTLCANDSVLEYTSTSYNCRPCSTSEKKYCKLVMYHNNQCLCGRCIPGLNPRKYFMKPDHSDCIECYKNITNCAEYTLKWKDNEYVCACGLCLNNEIPTDDGKHCVNCTSKTCEIGCFVYADDNKECKCKCNETLIHPLTNQTNIHINNNQSTNQTLNRNCIVCNSTTISHCEDDGFYLSENKTCLCRECKIGYVLDKHKMSCLNCSSNCKICKLNETNPDFIEKCIECNEEFALRPRNFNNISECVKCEDGCKFCSLNEENMETVSLCNECKSGYTMNSEKKCIKCPQFPTPCQRCRIDPEDNRKTICLQFGCQDFHSLTDVGFKCEKCKIENCKTCFTNIEGNSKCIDCADGFFLKNQSVCEPCATNCSFCKEKSTCLPDGCNIGYIRHKILGNCLPCPGTGVKYCQYESTQSNKLIVKSCKSGFVLVNQNNQKTCESKFSLIFVFFLKLNLNFV